MSKNSKGSAGKVIAGLSFGIAAGTALGFFALAPNVPGGPVAKDSSAVQQLKDEKAARDKAEGQSAASDKVLGSVSGPAVRNLLRGTSVNLFVLPDADQANTDSLKRLIKMAGGSVNGVIELTDKALSADSGDSLKSIAANSLPAGAKLSEDKLDPGMHTGQLLGAALAAGDKEASETDRGIALGALSNEDLIAYQGEAPKAADLALVVGGDTSDDAAHGNYSTKFVADFVAGLDSRTKGAVLAAQAGSAEDNGAIGQVRADKDAKEAVSTIDNVDTVAGRIATIRALGQQKDNKAGHYGAASNASDATPE